MLLREFWVTNEYGKTSTIDPNTQEEISFVGKLDLIEYNNNKCCYGLKKVNSPSLIDDQINSDMLPAKIIIPQNITPPRIGSKIIVFIEGIDHYMSDYLQGYKSQSSPGFVPGINLGQLSESLNEKADRDLQNLNSTGTNKFSDPDLSNLSDDGKNITNWSSNVTNCITEIPQDIKLELNNGTLTLKAGSKLYKPNGFEADGTTPKFDEVVITVDKTGLEWLGTDINDEMIFYEIGGGIDGTFPEYCTSGTSYPSSPSNGYRCYRTDLNRLYVYRTSSSSWIEKEALPLGIVRSSGTAGKVGSIDQVFNGFGYIGSTVFALPGVKIQIPNGRNADGTYINYIEEITSVKTNTFTSESGSVDLYYNSDIKSLGAAYTGTYIYDSSTNSYVNKVTGFNVTTLINVANCICTSGKISSFKFADVDSVANSNASNFSQAGRSYLSGLGMPSNRYINLTLGASGSTYTAPANGYFVISKDFNASGQFVVLYNQANGLRTMQQPASTSGNASCIMPAKKGQNVLCEYSLGGNTSWFKFVYAEGDQ